MTDKANIGALATTTERKRKAMLQAIEKKAKEEREDKHNLRPMRLNGEQPARNPWKPKGVK